MRPCNPPVPLEFAAEPRVLHAAPVVTARLECGFPLGLLFLFLVAAGAGAGCFFKRQLHAKDARHERLQPSCELAALT